MTKYETLLVVLDKLCTEAPSSFRRYHPKPTDTDGRNKAQARALIHLYLKVKFGLLSFTEREHFITDGTGDSGIDAYFIDHDRRIVYAFQSKFRSTAGNFENKNIEVEELLSIELGPILKGKEASVGGNPWNGKIKQFQREYQETKYHAAFDVQVVILANCKKLTQVQLKRLCEGYPVEVFDHDRVYEELLFPVISGTFYNASDLEIRINLGNVSSGQGRVSYTAKTSEFNCNVTLVFVPVVELGRILFKYRNSILYFNPRSFLGLSRNTVNQEIESTITKDKGNEFALFNNGVTIISDETKYSDSTGQLDVAQLLLRNPQIINGGQTAYTLCRLYERAQKDEISSAIFDGKEVLLKVITLPFSSDESKLHLIERISRATNFQTQVEEADRRSNEKAQVNLQRHFFSKYGLFYERKAGEFADGIESAYIEPNAIIDRDVLMRVSLAGEMKVSESRGSIKKFYSKEAFEQDILAASLYRKYAFGYRCYLELMTIQKSLLRTKDNFGTRKYGDALRYGKFAVVAVCIKKANGTYTGNIEDSVTLVLNQWKRFEMKVKRDASNARYFRGELARGAVAYYKGKTINADLNSFKFK